MGRDIGWIKESKRKELEAKYVQYRAHNDLAKAFNTVKELASYHMIDHSDGRLGNKSAMAEERADLHQQALNALRQTPEFSVIKLPYSIKSSITIEEHWGKRVEGVYEGDVIFPGRDLELTITKIGQPKAVENSVSAMEKDLAAIRGKKRAVHGYMEKFAEGDSAIYKINTASGVSFRHPNIGYATVTYVNGNDTIQVAIVLRHDILKEQFIMVKQAYSNILLAFKKALNKECKADNFKLSIISFVPPDTMNAIDRQQREALAVNLSGHNK
jgi:hypothetical protein